MAAHPIKVFISYAWSSEEHIEKVINLAQRLVNDGIDVIIDKWNLKPGNDKYRFMEQAVTESDVKNVLIICDQKYAMRADKREGGVGDETLLISPEVYSKTNQDKFIPLVFEYESPQKPYCPAYLKSLLFIDFSESADQEKAYEQLLRHIYNEPQLQKPAIGKRPLWLNEPASVNLSALSGIMVQLRNDNGTNPRKLLSICCNFQDRFFSSLQEYAIPQDQLKDSKIVFDKIIEAKSLRDMFLDFYQTLLGTPVDIVNFSTTFFERFHNEANIRDNQHREPLQFLLWEGFVCAITILFKREFYAEIGNILRHSYFAEGKDGIITYIRFRPYIEELEHYKKSAEINKISIEGHILSTREWLPMLKIEDLARTDIILCQLSFIYFKGDSEYFRGWFPMAYIYFSEDRKIWCRLKSKEFCQKILPLFDVTTINELKQKISKYPVPDDYRYRDAWSSAPNILSDIIIEDIATAY